ncbi:hypothetical protein [Streptomyces sp. NPDC047990]|uniref:hypothetical protein n=1 Tax=Streptomyces sp. NPDC047990 TaxID=3365496 RepID=UPI0037129F2D
MVNFRTLADLAEWHMRQADPLAHPRRRAAELAEHQASADFLRSLIGNRAIADPTRLTLAGDLGIDGPGLWCERHGYRCISSAGAISVMAQRGDDAPVAAVRGDTLMWDGERITVRCAARPS